MGARKLFQRMWISAGIVVLVVAAALVPAAPAAGVTTAQDAAGGCDGIKNGRWGFHTASGETDAWWQVDLGEARKLDRVVVYNRLDRGMEKRTRNIRVLVAGRDAKKFSLVYQHNGKVFHGFGKGKPLVVALKDKNISARIVRLQVPGRCSFALDEIEVYAAKDPKKNIARGRPADQKSVGQHSFAPGGKPATVGPTPAPAQAHDALARGRQLVERIKAKADPRRLGPLTAELEKLTARRAKADEKDRPAIDLAARRLVRKIALCNPLLNFDKILFIKRHDAGGPYHMCDQYYGCNAKPGGGLFVLSDAFSENPKLTDLLANSVVRNGRLKGRKLQGGSFLSPELSYDGKTILFAYSECKAKKTYTWAPTYSYHIFKVNADPGAPGHLVQLTDGPADDFDPCFLPNGRIVFITERRGGYLRCGRHCPVYTMYSMADDGSDIICLSFHETHEWHPSVDNDGMIVYSRWDYVDRDTNIAHHIWTCYPDGRDPRSFHGNYPQRRNSRPWMEMSIRAIPNSQKYVATAAGHHGHAFGSLVMIDPWLRDDNAMSQLTRLTPDVRFPEAEGNTRKLAAYATAWPLSEDDYLCAYDAKARNHGIYWIDRHGNRELIYRDPKIASLSPIPLRPRRKPPVIPTATTQTALARKAPGARDRKATVSVVNVYDSDFPWPTGTKITALRIIQVLPKSTAPPNKPRIGVANQTNARAVLGTVPVEADGSVFFEAPVGKAIYFQALDASGMAVQSMRSATYVHPGERLTCNGCHEPKHRRSPQPPRLAAAFQRAPSKIKPDADGSNPFNYPRLVQGVLDRNCVDCHPKKKALDLTGTLAKKGGFTQSYNSLAGKYGFYFHVTNGSINTGVHGGSRTIAGKFGARAAPLMKYLDKRHYKVQLSEADRHRIVLWLDCNSEFLGAYEDAQAQARGEVVQPSLH